MLPSANYYQKFFYWFLPEHIDHALEECKAFLKKELIPIAKDRQCESLYLNSPIMHVPPEVWSKNCYRQGSWFRTSDYSKNHLIVSNIELHLSNTIRSGIIQRIAIKNYPPTPQKENYLALITSDSFLNRAPKEWFHFLEREIPTFQSFIDRNHLSVTLAELLDIHTANHANFLLPAGESFLTCELEGESIPCSLFPQEFTCSACLELFGILGEHLKKKVIKKCPGLKYVNLQNYEYFLVKFN